MAWSTEIRFLLWWLEASLLPFWDVILIDQPFLDERALLTLVQKWYPVCGCEVCAGTGDCVYCWRQFSVQQIHDAGTLFLCCFWCLTCVVCVCHVYTVCTELLQDLILVPLPWLSSAATGPQHQQECRMATTTVNSLFFQSFLIKFRISW